MKIAEMQRSVMIGLLSFIATVLAGQSCQRAKADVTSVIKQTAIKQGIDPNLALAVAEVESSLNPKATGKAGEVGLFQLHPRFHPNASYEINKNVHMGIRTLIYWKTNCPTKTNNTWITCFNSGNRKLQSPQTAPYYRKVMQRYYQRIIVPSHTPATAPVPSDRGPFFFVGLT